LATGSATSSIHVSGSDARKRDISEYPE